MFRRNMAVVLVAAVALSMLAATVPSPAQAGDTGKIIAGIVIGGIIGAALSDQDRDRCRPGYGYGPPVGRPYHRYDPPRGGYWTPPRQAYNEGYRDGWYDGREVGRQQGYQWGYSDGRRDQRYSYGPYGGGYGGYSGGYSYGYGGYGGCGW